MNLYTMNETHKKGIFNMMIYIRTMIQDHTIYDRAFINGNYIRFKDIYEKLVILDKRNNYDDDDKKYLNEVRNLVLHWRNGNLMDCPQYDDLPF